MKKLLSVLGAISISASGSAALLTSKTSETHLQAVENKNLSQIANLEDNPYFEINNLKEKYLLLSENEKINFAKEMAKLPQLKIDEIQPFLENSKVSFIQENRQTIEMMYLFSLSITNLDQFSSLALELNLDWKLINEYINLDFGDSNDYTPQVSNYGPSAWWKIWEWGWQADLPEGLVNLVRILNLIYSLYDNLDLQPVETLVMSAKEIFDYLVNLDDHGTDKMSVFYKMLVNTENDLKTSGIPFTNQVYDVFAEAISELKKFEALHDVIPISLAAPIIKQKISEKIGMPFEEIEPKYSGILNSFVDALHQAKETLDNQFGLPDFIWNFLNGSILKPVASQIVNADQNHNGVYIQFEQYLIPLGFKPR